VPVAPEVRKAEPAEQEWVAVASFENRHQAEHMLLSLGRKGRRNARKAGATPLVASGKQDGSLKLAPSRVLEAGAVTALLLHISVSWMVGFWGTVSIVKGAKGGAHAAKRRKSYVGSSEERAAEIIAEVGPEAAIMLVPCTSSDMAATIAARAHDLGRRSWHGPLAKLLAGLQPGSTDDLVRSALEKPSAATR
jgi:hypothetical protein